MSMKKMNYLAPAIDVIELEIEAAILTASGDGAMMEDMTPGVTI